MQLSPLQSRLVASVLASFFILVLYLILFPPSFALAAEIPSEHDIPQYGIVRDATHNDDDDSNLKPVLSDVYEPIFSSFDRSIVGRQATDQTVLENNVAQSIDLRQGETRLFVFQVQGAAQSRRDLDDDDAEDEHGREKRQQATQVCISANTCRRPENTNDTTKTTVPAPQLTLYLSTVLDNTSPGPDGDPGQQEPNVFTQGAVMVNITTDANIYFAVTAPQLMSEFEGDYSFQVAASTEGCYYVYDSTFDGNITWVESDASGALLVANNVPIGSDSEAMPYVLFAQSRANDYNVNGVLFSYCGLQTYAEVEVSANNPSDSVATRISKRQEDSGTGLKQQFYFSGLEDNSFYWGILALEGRAAAGNGQGGTVFSATNFTTASVGGTCELIFPFDLCPDIDYPVPGNKAKFPTPDSLRDFYSNYTNTTFANFQKAIAQVPCEAPPSQAYSLVRNCSDCENAYRQWLCAVAVPRCHEVTAEEDYLMPRNFAKTFANGTRLAQEIIDQNNSTAELVSRNSFLDQMIAPGPYKEMLPCDTLCYNLVQSCPASLGFACPLPGMIGFNTSYGEQARGRDRCNQPMIPRSGAGGPPTVPISLILALVAMMVVVI